MLTYEKFKEETKEILEELIENTPYELVYHEVNKVNAAFDAVSLRGKEATVHISPTLYFNEAYEQYKKGGSVEGAAKHMIGVLTNRLQNEELDDFVNGLDLKKYKDKIMPRVINFEKNTALLDECVYRKYLDLAIIYCFVIPFSIGEGTITITKNLAELIDMTEEELYEISKKNALRLYEPHVTGLNPPFEEAPCLYAISNKVFVNGSYYLIPELFLDKFAASLEEDLFVFPSSRHEIIVMKWDDTVIKECKEMVCSANKLLTEEEFLSDSVYRYCRDTKTLVIVSEEEPEKSIVEKVKEINWEDAGLLGFAISESLDCYSDTGEAVISLFERYPDNAELLEKMLVAVCGYGIDSLKEKMEESREYYNSL